MGFDAARNSPRPLAPSGAGRRLTSRGRARGRHKPGGFCGNLMHFALKRGRIVYREGRLERPP